MDIKSVKQEIVDDVKAIGILQDKVKRTLEIIAPYIADHQIDDILIRNGEKAKVVDVSASYNDEDGFVSHYEIRKIRKDGGLHGLINRINSSNMQGWEANYGEDTDGEHAEVDSGDFEEAVSRYGDQRL